MQAIFTLNTAYVISQNNKIIKFDIKENYALSIQLTLSMTATGYMVVVEGWQGKGGG